MKISRGLIFATMPDAGTDRHYAGKGVKLGEKDRPIFWYKPKGRDDYRVIYGDLSVKTTKTAPQ